MEIKHHYLNFPVKNGASKRWVFLKSGERVLREFEIELEDWQPGVNEQGVDWWAFLDVSAWMGQEITSSADPHDASYGFDSLPQSDEILDLTGLYQEKYRPQFHFSPRRGWMNDPKTLQVFKLRSAW